MFTLRKIEGGRLNVFEPVVYPVGSSAAVTEGEPLVLTSGKLTKCGATAKPTYIALESGAASTSDKTVMISVGRVESNQVYEISIAEENTNVKIATLVPGTKVSFKFDSNGVLEGASTVAGAVEIVDTNGATKVGDTIYVRF